MDVRCQRCATEYEFDDALVSDRGTTVECTNCGYKFKVYPPNRGRGAPERWVVRTVSGRELVYTSLRDLQKGISRGQVGPQDQLSRDNQPPRLLESIAELEPFFGASSRAERMRNPQTLSGVAPPPNLIPGGAPGSSPMAAPLPADPPASAPSSAVDSPQRVLVAHPATAPQRATGPGATVGITDKAPHTIREAAPAPAPGSAPRPEDDEAEPPSMRPRAPDFALAGPPSPSDAPTPPRGARVPINQTVSLADPAASPGSAAGVQSPSSVDSMVETQRIPRSSELSEDPVTVPRGLPQVAPRADLDQTARLPDFVPGGQPAPVIHQEQSTPFHSPVPPHAAESYDESLSDPDPRFVIPTGSRSARSRWIVAVVLIGVLLLFAGTVGRDYLSKFAQRGAAEQPKTDGRVAKLLEDGTRLMGEGDFDAAREEFVKASVLAERDAAVLAALARLETLRADLVWLELRLLDPADQESVKATHRRLGERVGRARTAVQSATEVAPEDPDVLRARVDWFRLGGQVKKARDIVGPLSALASEPRNAYVLAALDLAEPAPAWTTVIERLRVAATAEGKLGHARAVLVYALARYGSNEQAVAELEKLRAADQPHPLTEQLAAFVERFGAVAEADAGADAAQLVDPSRLGALDTSYAEGAADAAGAVRGKLNAAGRALRTGQLEQARSLYSAVLARDPNNTEAMAGLAEIARLKNDSSGSAEMYDRVLEQNPTYIPAMTARADQKWESGDRAGAIAIYRRIVEQVGTGNPYGSKAAARIAQGPGSSQPSPPPTPTAQPTATGAAPAPTPAPTPAPAPAPTPEQPHIDTTDLPEFSE